MNPGVAPRVLIIHDEDFKGRLSDRLEEVPRCNVRMCSPSMRLERRAPEKVFCSALARCSYVV